MNVESVISSVKILGKNASESAKILVSEIDRLRQEVAMLTDQRNEHIKGSADATTQCIEYQHMLAELREENKWLRAVLDSACAKMKQCRYVEARSDMLQAIDAARSAKT